MSSQEHSTEDREEIRVNQAVSVSCSLSQGATCTLVESPRWVRPSAPKRVEAPKFGNPVYCTAERER